MKKEKNARKKRKNYNFEKGIKKKNKGIKVRLWITCQKLAVLVVFGVMPHFFFLFRFSLSLIFHRGLNTVYIHFPPPHSPLDKKGKKKINKMKKNICITKIRDSFL